MTSLNDLPIRDDLRGREPYGAPQLNMPVRLNVNESPHPPSPRLVRALAEAVTEVAGSLNRYPDRDVVELRKDLAGHLGHGLTASQIWVANGSSEILQQVLQVFGGAGRRVLGFEPSYSMYWITTHVSGAEWVNAAREEDFGIDHGRAVAAIKEHRPDVVILTSPNNPTGTALPLDLIETLLDATPGVIVIDEAYAEFRRPGTPSALSLLPGNPRLIVTRTMSKAFAMAGARLGYMAADPAVIEAIQLVRLPYHLSAVTQAVARTALAFKDELLGTVDALRAERDDLAIWLRERGFEVADSDANFVLFGRFADRRRVWHGLLDHGVLIREVGPPGWLRVCMGLPEEMEAFRRALAEVVG